MTAKTALSAAVLATFATIALVGTADAKSATQIRQEAIDAREAKQAEAIVEGRRDGSLTWWEKNRLVREQKRVQKLEAQAIADGKITKGEYLAIKGNQNDAGRHITGEKHNEAVRGWWWRTFVR
jgi:hypothetical protein